MLKQNLLTAWRNLMKEKIPSLINILGLVLGLTCAILAILFSYHELTFENCHKNADRICKAYTYGQFGGIDKLPAAFGPVAGIIKANFPEVEKTSRSINVGATIFKNEEPIAENNLLISDQELFEILTFSFLSGNNPTKPTQVCLSRPMAIKYFGSTDIIGKELPINIHGRKQLYTVSGVFQEFPSNTHVEAKFVIPFEFVKQIPYWKPDEFTDVQYIIYTLLQPGTNVKALNLKLAEIIDSPINIENFKTALIPIKQIHLHADLLKNSKANLMALLFGGIITLIISLFNTINHTTILFTTRLKEIGIKKTIGGSKNIIFKQFFVEAGLSVFLSFIISMGVLILLLPHFNQLMDTQIELNFSWQVALLVLGTLLFTIFLSSVYPAFNSLKVNSIALIREGSTPFLGRRKLSNILITVQFIVAILLIQFIIINQKQTNYMFAQDVIKYDANNVICLNGYNWGDLTTVKQELLKNEAIESVSWGQNLPGANFNMNSDWKNAENKEMANRFSCESDYLEVFKIKMKAGRFIDNTLPSDQKYSVVINQLTANSLGYDDPINKQIEISGKQLTIVGVTDDYLAEPPVVERMPLIITPAGNQSNYLLIRVNPKSREVAHAHIKDALRKINPNQPIDIRYYEDITLENAKSYIATDVFIKAFSGIIIFNAMLGLFAMSLFIAQRKNKEIGIRKACGAATMEVAWKLSAGFVKKLMLALLIASPLGYIFGQGYISLFVTKIKLTPDIFLIGGLVSLAMVFVASGWKVIAAARRNPVEALRYE